ncbi:VOC family protein [Streptomyces sp. NPDC056660]|uniref:VOC family protein n=1 Tax=Streptomyces sp. NPDC056660 TaxID=3345897 RepID=UPI00369F25E2
MRARREPVPYPAADAPVRRAGGRDTRGSRTDTVSGQTAGCRRPRGFRRVEHLTRPGHSGAGRPPAHRHRPTALPATWSGKAGSVKNRVHLDLATPSAAHQAELVARLRALGATPADVGQGDVPWTVLADPDGNEFCVLEPRESYRDTQPIAAVVVDCADPRAMARFWDEATDWTLHRVTDGHAVLRSAKGVGPYLEFLRKPGVKTLPDRVHLDLAPCPSDDQEAEVTRLRALGAADLDLGQDDVSWRCLTDPDGHEFCVLARP